MALSLFSCSRCYSCQYCPSTPIGSVCRPFLLTTEAEPNITSVPKKYTQSPRNIEHHASSPKPLTTRGVPCIKVPRLAQLVVQHTLEAAALAARLAQKQCVRSGFLASDAFLLALRSTILQG